MTFPAGRPVRGAAAPRAVSWSPVRFATLDDGSEYVHVGHRASPKVQN
jgi:hypothetical protein